jgi:hypothetical protein
VGSFVKELEELRMKRGGLVTSPSLSWPADLGQGNACVILASRASSLVVWACVHMFDASARR